MSNDYLVSVIIPTYNQHGQLSGTVDSALAQSYKNIEIIVVDDNNPDTDARKETEKLMSVYEQNPKVKYIKHKFNKNGSAARNTGFRASKGNYIAFLDDDDYWEKDKLKKQVDYLNSNRNLDAVYVYLYVTNGGKNPNHCCEGDLSIQYLTNYVSLQTSCVLFSRKSVEKLNGFDESFRRHQDYEFMLRFFLDGFKMGCVPEYLSHVNSAGSNRVSGVKLNELKEKFLETFDKQFDELDRKNPGTKKKIIVANYAKVFESHMAGRCYRLAFNVFKKYFFMSPVEFCKQCLNLLLNHYKRAKSSKEAINNARN